MEGKAVNFFVITKTFCNLDVLLLQDARGNDVNLSTYKGKVLLIVNVASQW